MKKFTTDAIINIFLLTLLGSWGLYRLIPTGVFRNHAATTMVLSDTAYTSVTIPPSVTTKTSCDICRDHKDSLDRAEALRNGKFRRDMGAPFGQAVRGYFYTDAEISNYRGYENINKDPDYFFALSYWNLASVDHRHSVVKYYVENKQAYINAFDYKENRLGTRKNKTVSFKYDPEKKQILIPVTESQYKTIRVLFVILAFLILFPLYLFVMAGGIMKFLLAVARGEVFTEKNIRRLKIIAFISFIMPLSSLILNYSFKFIFHKYFNEYVEFKTELLYDQGKYYLIAIICFLLYRAFYKGYKLQRDNDLTV